MGAITTLINSVYRDYATDGVPGSGPNPPLKSEIRAIGPVIEAVTTGLESEIAVLRASQVGGVIGYDTQAHLYADLVHAAGIIAEVFSDADPTKNGVYIKVGASGAGSWSLQAGVESRQSITDDLNELVPSLKVQDSERGVDRIAVDAGVIGFDVAEGQALTFPIGGGFKFFAKAIDPARTIFASALLIPIIISQATAFQKIDLRVWRRPRASPSNSGPGITGDQLMFSAQVAPSGIASGSGIMQMARVELGLEMTPDYTWIVAWVALDSLSGVMVLGAALKFDSIVGTSYSPGWYGFGGHNGSYAQTDITQPLALLVVESAPEKRPVTGGANTEIVYAGADPSLAVSPNAYSRTLAMDALLKTGPFQIRQDHTVTIPATEIARSSGRLSIPSQDVVLTDLTVDTVAAEAITLTYNAIVNLSHRYVTSVVVTRVSDSATLVEGTDYVLAWELGQLRGLVNTAPFAIHVAFLGTYHRYDLIYVDPDTGVVGKADGTARLIDPEEYRPALPAGKVPLYAIYFFRYSNVDVIEVMPIHQWRDYVRIGYEAEHERWLEYCRECLPQTFQKLHRGDAFTIVMYGDSNGNMGSSNTQYTRQTADNQLGFFTSQRTPSDTAALYNGLQFTEDAISKVPLNWPYFVKEAMESRFGSKVSLQNFSISGTGSGSVGAYDGANASRMAGVIAASPNLVIIAFGMNAADYTSMETIIQTFQAAGIECIVLGIPRVNFYSGTMTVGVATPQAWSAANEMLVRVARANRCAYVNPEVLFARGNEGACGLSQRTMGGANSYNHSGITERRILGEYMAKIFGGRTGAIPTGPAVGHVSIQVPTTGFAITIGSSTKTLILKPAATLATGTVTMPATPADEAIVRISSSQIITALTVSPNSGQSILNAPTTLAAGAGVSFVYDTTTATWYRLQ
jgi:hypothetical protein